MFYWIKRLFINLMFRKPSFYPLNYKGAAVGSSPAVRLFEPAGKTTLRPAVPAKSMAKQLALARCASAIVGAKVHNSTESANCFSRLMYRFFVFRHQWPWRRCAPKRLSTNEGEALKYTPALKALRAFDRLTSPPAERMGRRSV